jgi:hypothetical protein
MTAAIIALLFWLNAPGTVQGGADLGSEARHLFAITACRNKELASNIDPRAIADYCAWFERQAARYRKNYLAKAQKFFAGLRPANLPTTVIYPFGGGDLLSALATYPDANEIVTLSLELAGDPRRTDKIDSETLKVSLSELQKSLAGLLTQGNAKSENLSAGQRGEIPSQLTSSLVALGVLGYKPVSLRYFTVQKNGSLHYLTSGEIQRLENETTRPKHQKWTPPDFSPAFANSELTFRRTDSGPLCVHRHIAANLFDWALKRNPGVIKYLQSKGPVAAMTKAASFCLWRPDFSLIRDYLLANMEFMVSDSTGIPPEFAKKAGFQQETYGTFSGSYLPASEEYNNQFRDLWKSQPERILPFRYGYLDSKLSPHMVITKK